MDKPVKCFIPAAGLGERLRPITDHIPKPLIPILGKPVLQTILENVSLLSLDGIGVNLHYKRDIIEEWLRNSVFHGRTALFPEDPILDTGGALKNAEGFLSGSTFLVHNSDIFTDMDLKSLVASHFLSGNLATLAVHDCPRFNNVAIDPKGFLRGVGKKRTLQPGTEKWTAFTGIAVYAPEFLTFLPEGKSSVVFAWLRAIARGYKVGTLDVSGCFWSDIGTPAAYASTLLDTLRADGEMVYINPSARGCLDAELDGYLVIEKDSMTGKGASLKNCIVLPGSRVGKGIYKNCIIGPDFKIDLNESEMGIPVENGSVFIGAGGSDRKYFRIRRDVKAAVLMRCAPGGPDFRRHIEYSRFFRTYGIPVPELIEEEPDKMGAIFEDLGDMSLYNWLKCPRDEDRIEDIYRRVLDIIIKLHTTVTGHVSECPLLQERVFDYDHLRWETSYFMERFVGGAGGMPVENNQALQDEFHRLASQVNSFPKTIIHRDFQAQNIMVANGRARLIDYQGARIGPPAYDVASLLWDPYYRLEETMRERLVRYYIGRMSSAAEGFDEHDFRATLLPCRLQRHMQALGAYGFLSMVKGKKYFLKHIPEALRVLKGEAVLAKEEYPELHKLVAGLQRACCFLHR
ncbi:MAG: phosphotransferase [Nitrospirae bacterium]|nr:phosphotransferase [Nitrospirota bacterium]MCL5238546.1 phosphotransferase [Nitrospirota bacterium]